MPGTHEGNGDEEPRPEPARRPWVHPSELPEQLFDQGPGTPDRSRRRLVPITAGVAGTLAVLGFGTLALGSLESPGGDSAGSVLTVTPTALGDGAADGLGGTVPGLEGTVVHVKAWAGPRARYASAVVVDERGTLVTAASAVAGAGALEVDTGNGRIHDAELVGLDRTNDLAVLRVVDAPLRSLAAGERAPASLAPGEGCWVVSAERDGDVLAHRGSITAADTIVRHGDGWMVDVIQVEAPMTERSAGGAVLDVSGDLIGIVSAPEGFGAVVVPAGQALASVAEIIAHGEARHPWIGVLAVESDDGVVVEAVAAGGPAEAAGIRPGDVIGAVDDTEIASVADLMRAVREHDDGETVTVALFRDDQTTTVSVRLSARP